MSKESRFPGRRLAVCLLIVLAGGLSLLTTLIGVRAAEAVVAEPGRTNKWETAAASVHQASSVIPIAYGDLVTGTIAVPGQTVTFTFEGASGDYAAIRVVDVPSTSLSLEINLYRPGGTHLCSAWGGDFVGMTCLLEESGTYTVEVKDSADTGTGAIRLYLQRTIDPVDAQPFPLGEPLAGSIDFAPVTDAYTLSIVSGTQIIARAIDMTASSFSPYIQFYAPVGESFCGNWGTDFLEMVCQPESTGDYVIFVGDIFGVSIGSYQLYLQRTTDPVNAAPIYYGQTLFDAIEVLPEMKAYTFNGTAGEQAEVTVWDSGNGPFDPEVRIYDLDGNLLCSYWDEVTAAVDCALPVNGVYLILVGDHNGEDAGNFAVGMSGYTIYLPAVPVK